MAPRIEGMRVEDVVSSEIKRLGLDKKPEKYDMSNFENSMKSLDLYTNKIIEEYVRVWNELEALGKVYDVIASEAVKQRGAYEEANKYHLDLLGKSASRIEAAKNRVADTFKKYKPMERIAAKPGQDSTPLAEGSVEEVDLGDMSPPDYQQPGQ